MRKSLIRTISTLEDALKDLDSKRVVYQPGYKPLLRERDPNANGGSRLKLSGSSESTLTTPRRRNTFGEYDEDDSDDTDLYSTSDEESDYEDEEEDIVHPKPSNNTNTPAVSNNAPITNAALPKLPSDDLYVRKVIFVQKYARRWLAARVYKQLIRFYEERGKIVRELVTHEQAYVLSLQYLCTYFISVLREEYKDESFIQTLFKTLEIIRKLHSNWLKLLQERVNQWNKRLEIGDVLRELIPCLDNYNFFCSNYLHLIHWIKEQAKNSSFARQEKRCCEDLQRNTGVATSLQILLSLPLTNLRQYNSILEDLSGWTHKGTKEYLALINTLDKIKEVAALAKSSVKSIENKHKVLAVQQSFTSGTPPILAVPNRVLIHDGPLLKLCRKRTQKRYFWLFNDIMIYGTALGPKQFKFHRHMPLVNSRFVDLPDDPSRQPYAFQIITANKSFIVFAHDNQEKKCWLSSHAKSTDMLKKRGSITKPKQDTQEMAPVWQHDNMSDSCLLCGTVFTVVKRRHHCRKCGKLVCGPCSPKKAVLENIGKAKRVCVTCHKDLPPTHSPVQKERSLVF